MKAAPCLALVLAACASAPPSTEGVHAIHGTELFVKRVGAGEPVVVVHGGPVLEHGYLLPHLEPLADSHELIFYDQRLCGRSAGEVDLETVSIAQFVADLEELRQTLGLGKIHLMAHSWGGLIAMRYAIAHPEQLRSLILLDSMSASSSLRYEEEQALVARATPELQARMAQVRGSEAFAQRRPEAFGELVRLSFVPLFHDPDRMRELELYVPDDYLARAQQFVAMMGDLVDYDLHGELRGVTVPTLLLYGSDEPGAAIGGAALREALPHAESVSIEGAGHFPFIEQPEEFLRAVREFCSGV